MDVKTLRKRALEFLRPPPRTKLADWLEQNIVIPSSDSSKPGPLRLNKFQAAWSEAVDNKKNTQITILKPTQIGYSVWLMSTACFFIDHDPSPMLVVYPNEGDARDVATGSFQGIVEQHEGLSELLKADRKKGSKTMTRRFPGGFIHFTNASSPKNLRRHSARVLIMDEISAMLPNIEGDPISLALQRASSWPDRRVIMGSTPTINGTCQALLQYEQSDKRIFEVGCPTCNERFELLWQHIIWPEGRPELAYAVCPHNGCVIDEAQKGLAVQLGDFRITAPHVEDHAGFKVNALVSDLPGARWGLLAARFLRVKDNPAGLQVFTNTVLAEGWDAVHSEELDVNDLADRAEDFSLDDLPEQVVLLTAGVDVQADRVECTVWGFDEQGGAWACDHRVFPGKPSTDEPWELLREFIQRDWPHKLGGRIKLTKVAIDSGYLPDQVYEFVRGKERRGWHAVKGVAGNDRATYSQPRKQKTKSGAAVGLVGVNTVKDTIFACATLDKDAPQSIHYSNDLTAQFFEQFTSEHRVTKQRNGAMVSSYERINSTVAAEALDCAVYAWAVKTTLGNKPANWEQHREKCGAQPAKPAASQTGPQDGKQKSREQRRAEAVSGLSKTMRNR